MRTYDVKPDDNTISRDVLGTTLRPVPRQPREVGLYEVAVNVARLFPRAKAAAVYWVPPVHKPHRTPKPGTLVLVVAALEQGAIRWYSGIVGEVG